MADSWPQQMPEQTVPEQTVPEQTVAEQTRRLTPGPSTCGWSATSPVS